MDENDVKHISGFVSAYIESKKKINMGLKILGRVAHYLESVVYENLNGLAKEVRIAGDSRDFIGLKNVNGYNSALGGYREIGDLMQKLELEGGSLDREFEKNLRGFINSKLEGV